MKVAIIPARRLRQNCAALECEEINHAAVVDPGGDLALLFDAVTQQGAVLEKNLLTHGHIDHCGGTAQLSQDLACR